MLDVFVALLNSDIKNSTRFKKGSFFIFNEKLRVLEFYLDIVNGGNSKM